MFKLQIFANNVIKLKMRYFRIFNPFKTETMLIALDI